MSTSYKTLAIQYDRTEAHDVALLTVKIESGSAYDVFDLVSAAPDLLKALRDMVEHGDITAFKKARAAIAKATGEQA